MRKIILDCGAHLGESTNKFRRIISNISEYEIYMFEPNPYLFSEIDKNSNFKECIRINKAVSNIDEKKIFWGCKSNQQSVGATLEISKAQFDQIKDDDKIEVDCLDLANFIQTNFNENDYILLKLDIEGAEYDVLEKLVETNTIKYINKLYCEFHTQWLNPSFIVREANIRKILLKFRLIPEPWDAL